MHYLLYAPAQAFQHQKHPSALETASCTSCAGAHDHQCQQYCLGQPRPQIKICRGVPGSGNDAGYLEGGVPYRLLQGLIGSLEIPCNQKDASGHQTQIEPKLLVPQHVFYLTDQKQIITAEIDAE